MKVLTQSKRDLSQVTTGIVHIGFGAFHRAHQAMYIDQLLKSPEQQHWGVCAINLRASESKLTHALAEQNYRYILRTLDGKSPANYQQIQSHTAIIDAISQPNEAVQQMTSPDVKLVTMTVTESGYYQTSEGDLDTNNSSIKDDLEHQGMKTLYGYLSQSLNARMLANSGPITLLCCDNLRHNGNVLEKGFKSFLRQQGKSNLIQWLDQNASFPCSMVDRITPRSDQALYDDIFQQFGHKDTCAVSSETFCQWVIEDNFAAEKPAFEKVGVEWVKEVDAHEEAKIRILNGGHSALAYFSALKNITYFDQALNDPELVDFLSQYHQQEVIPSLKNSPIKLSDYSDIVIQRFKNKSIGDTVERICSDGYSKMNVFIRPTIEAALAEKRQPIHAYKIIASWLVFCQKAQQSKINFKYSDSYWSHIEAWLNHQNPFTAMATDQQYWGHILSTNPNFISGLEKACFTVQRQFNHD